MFYRRLPTLICEMLSSGRTSLSMMLSRPPFGVDFDVALDALLPDAHVPARLGGSGYASGRVVLLDARPGCVDEWSGTSSVVRITVVGRVDEAEEPRCWDEEEKRRDDEEDVCWDGVLYDEGGASIIFCPLPPVRRDKAFDTVLPAGFDGELPNPVLLALSWRDREAGRTVDAESSLSSIVMGEDE
jgi:hypothetical protein